MQQTKANKFTRFLRNNLALILIIACVLAITAIVLVTTLQPGAPTPDAPVVKDPDTSEDDEPVVTPPEVETFGSPIAYTSVGMAFTNKKDVLFVFNSTLDVWETHKAVDLIATEGAAVVSMHSGTVLSVGESYGYGKTIKVDHGDGIVATYASLLTTDVIAGQVIKKGDKLGTVGSTASYEFEDGAHLHLEVTKNQIAVDPLTVIAGDDEK
ncbi:MAG: M23 family metallopeptidase [Clostridia bacterium]